MNTKKGHAINAETTEPTEEQSGNTRRVDDVIEKLTKHSFDNEDNWSYLVHWYDNDNSHDTWEPLSALPRNAIVATNGNKFRYRRASIMLEMDKRRITSLENSLRNNEVSTKSAKICRSNNNDQAWPVLQYVSNAFRSKMRFHKTVPF